MAPRPPRPLLPSEQASENGYPRVVTLIEIARTNPWKQKAMQAAGLLAATAGLRVQRLAKIDGLRTQAADVGCMGVTAAACLESCPLGMPYSTYIRTS